MRGPVHFRQTRHNFSWVPHLSYINTHRRARPADLIAKRLCAALAAAVLCCAPAWAQPAPASTDSPVVKAVRLGPEEPITVDGALDEPAWQRAEPASDLRQSDPHNGEPATERTEIRILFNRDVLYIGAELLDSDSDGVLGNQMVRDGDFSADDRFMWILDPFFDQRSGYFFEVNAAGAMGDAQLVPAQGGSSFGSTQNRAWNGIWKVRVRRHERGWTAEAEIPFRTLSFNPHAQAWGANFQRAVRRKSEDNFWTGWGHNQGLFNLSVAGRIEGIDQVSQGHGLDVKPSVIGTFTNTAASASSTFKGAGALDLFYSLTPQLKTTFTINTDFAQTEVDDRQVNLTRFPLFFPEKRDFFLESAGNFDFSREANNNLTAFFSRRVGLGEDGRPQKIDYGMKMTGQAGRFDLGAMHVQTAKDRGILGEEFTILRPKRRLFTQSYAGAIYTRRATRNAIIPDRQTIGADFELATSRFRGNQNLLFSGFYLKTPNAAKGDDNAAWGWRLSYPNDRWNLRVAYKDFQPSVDPALGFIERADYNKWTPFIQFAPRPKNSRWIRQVTMGASSELYSDQRGRWIERFATFTLLNVALHSGDSASFSVTPTQEYFPNDFRISRGVTILAGSEYRHTRYSLNYRTANQRPIAINGNLTLGTFYSGHRRDVSATLLVRPRRGLLATLTSSFNRVELTQGNFSTKVLRAVVDTQFSPFISISNNIQYDSVSRVLGWQSRFRHIITAGNDIYFVWMNNWVDSLDRLVTLDRNAAVKAIYTYRF